MRIQLSLLAVFLVVACPIGLAQSAGKNIENTQPERTFKPKLLLPEAWKIAEDYVRANHIDLSRHWLYEVRFIAYGEKDKTQPAWHILWVSDGVAQGPVDYKDLDIDIVVFMDGKAVRTPTM